MVLRIQEVSFVLGEQNVLIEKLYVQQEENNMLFNGTKFEILRCGQNKDLKHRTMYFTPGMENIIEEKEYTRDLGVMMTNSATFNNHINLVCIKVNKKSGYIFRNNQK